MKVQALAQGRQNGRLHVVVASQPIVSFNRALGVFRTSRVLAANRQNGKRIYALLDSGLEFDSFRTGLFGSPHLPLDAGGVLKGWRIGLRP
ncbi:MAG TPA: hypothetical protein VGF82_27240 [Terracidiphilus sp.]